MIELNVTNLVGGNIVITTSSGGGGSEIPIVSSPTIVTYIDSNWDRTTSRSYDIVGELNNQNCPTSIEIDEEVWEFQNIEIGNSVTTIGDAFPGQIYLSDISLPSSVTTISSGAFDNCGELNEITLPDSVTSIGENAFRECYNLSTVTIYANGGNAANVRQMMIDAGAEFVTEWNMPS